jgi:hypothetical protein
MLWAWRQRPLTPTLSRKRGEGVRAVPNFPKHARTEAQSAR